MRNIIDRFDGTEYSFLSNFHPHVVRYEGLKYPTSEHAFQAAKTLDASERLVVSGIDTPGQAKRSGRKLTLRPDWEQIKVRVMYDILRNKFTDRKLSKKLLDTGTAELVEGNTWGDTFWGVVDGIGENWLGKLLMLVRDELKDYKISELQDEVSYLKTQIEQLEMQAFINEPYDKQRD